VLPTRWSLVHDKQLKYAGVYLLGYGAKDLEGHLARSATKALAGRTLLRLLFFRWRSSEAKLTRRRRIRLLTKLNRLTEAYPIEVFSNQGSPAHAELVNILHELASPPVKFDLVGACPQRAVQREPSGTSQRAE
jgi:hypothetical protein